jgi:hypothetical protein
MSPLAPLSSKYSTQEHGHVPLRRAWQDAEPKLVQHSDKVMVGSPDIMNAALALKNKTVLASKQIRQMYWN